MTVDGKPAFLWAANLDPFVSEELAASTTPLEFVPLRGCGHQGRAFGYKASLLPDVCWVYQDAMVAKKLLPSRSTSGRPPERSSKPSRTMPSRNWSTLPLAMRTCASAQRINKIIEKYVEKSARTWVLMFDLDFYRRLFRLDGCEFKPKATAQPGVVGRWTNDIYDRLAPCVRQELHCRVRRNEVGKPTQCLTPEESKPRRKEPLESVKLLMRMSATWPEFQARLDEFYPRHDDPPILPPADVAV